ncbi:hypothetical protein HPP92_022509 [Vanilla planifolia]|uniref:Uncharacterized protein n=1 Tax=Vanilla planifolia TaxID=51239 RepID=A0A835PSB2_VANPL|nr:hypothetical protein HPP92_022509 [Vanilla planifolia]
MRPGSQCLAKPRVRHGSGQGDKCPFMHGPRSADIILEEPSKIGYSELTRAQDQLFEFCSDPFQIGKEAEEHEPDDFSNKFIPDERNMHFEEDYDQPCFGYESSSRLEMDGYNEPVDYQYYRKLQHSVNGDRHWTPSASERILDELEFSKRRSSLRFSSLVEMDASDLRHRLTKQRRLNGSSCIKSDGHSYWNRLGGRFGGRAAENFHYKARKMGRKEKAGDAVNPLDFAGPRSLAELRGARADATKNIDSISSLEPESKKCLKEAELPAKRSAGPQNEEILVASNNRKEENEGLHLRKDAHKGNFENYDRIGVDQPKVKTCAKEEALHHADGDRITHGQHAIGDETEPWYSNRTDGGCVAEAGVDYKRKYDITGCMDVDPEEHDEEDDFARRINLVYS